MKCLLYFKAASPCFRLFRSSFTARMATTSVPTAVILDPVTIAQFTTAFKAPESCNTIVWACTRNTGQTMFYCWPERDSRCNSDGWHGPAASCYPDGERFIEIRSRSVIPVYSPAQQCPEGWGPALSYSTTAGHTTETVSCCPSYVSPFIFPIGLVRGVD